MPWSRWRLEAAAALEAHLEAWGDGGPLRQAEEAVTVARGQLGSLERALERDRRALEQLAARSVAAERRGALLEDEDRELAERLSDTEQARHRLQTVVAEMESAHSQATARLEAAEQALRQAEQELHRSVARADALEKAFDEARGAAGAELLAGVDGVVGTLLDVVEVDAGWEAAFEAAAGASVAAVVVSGSEPARQALARLRQGGATGAVLALTGAVPADVGHIEAPAWYRTHPPAMCAPAAGTSDFPGSTWFSTRSCPAHSVPRADGPRPSTWLWPAPIWWSSPGTATGSHRADGGCGPVVRPSPPTWSKRRDRGRKWRPWPPPTPLRSGRRRGPGWRPPEWPPWRPCGRTTTTRSIHQTARASAPDGWLTTGRPWRSSSRSCGWPASSWTNGLPGTRDGPTSSNSSSPRLEEAKAQAADEAAARPRKNGGGSTSGMTNAATARSEWEVRSAGLVERRRVLTERLEEVERRLTGHADERRLAAERRRRLEADATAVERLSAEVARAQGQLDGTLAQLRDRHRRQLEAVRAGGARLEELRRQRSAQEHELAAVRGRLQKSELDLVEATVRREVGHRKPAAGTGLRTRRGHGRAGARAGRGVGSCDPDRRAGGRSGGPGSGQPSRSGGAGRAQ